MSSGKTKKSNRVINGYKQDDNVLVLGKTREEDEVKLVRQVGQAGFYVPCLSGSRTPQNQ